MSEFSSLLTTRLAPFGILSDAQLALLEAHYRLLLRWNARMNLTRITDLSAAVELHYCESLFLALHLPAGALTIGDIGSGAGFPGFPIAVCRPDCEVHLIESNARKAAFLREACSIPNVRVVSKRAEEVNDDFDWVVSRAVSVSDFMGLKLSKCFALLGSAELTSTYSSARAVTVPWGSGRSLVMGER